MKFKVVPIYYMLIYDNMKHAIGFIDVTLISSVML
jgi:hypothetical protein